MGTFPEALQSPLMTASERLASMLRGRPEPLAMLRMVVPLIAVLSPEPSDAARIAAAPALALHPPAWLDVLAPLLPISPTLVLCARGVFFAAALFAILGMYTRFAMPAFATALFYLFSIPQRTGTVLHDMHLVWFAVLLAVSPCADVWSVDARKDASRAPPRAMACRSFSCDSCSV